MAIQTSTWRPRPTLTGTDYTSEETFAEERERIWWGGWICIGRAAEIPVPGDYLVRDLAGESIVVTRKPGRRGPSLLQRVRPPRDEAA